MRESEFLTAVIQKRLSNLSISNVEEMGWRGIKNGQLLDLMSGQFQILVTTDKNLPSQQNLKKRRISAVILSTNDIPSSSSCCPRSSNLLPPLTQEIPRN
jgi:hypothetical protein